MILSVAHPFAGSSIAGINRRSSMGDLMRMIRCCLATILFCLSVLGADNRLTATPQELFGAFQDSIIGLVVGDSGTVLKYASARYMQGIVDQNRKDLVNYRNDSGVRKVFEDLTGQTFDALLALPDRELAIVVIEKFVPATRTPEEKQNLVSAMKSAVLEGHAIMDEMIVLKVRYSDGTAEQAVFIKERSSWRLDEIK